jgi:nucleotide-binding universal stress UspA family protein
MYQKILVALDGSESSQRALREALLLAKRSGAQLRAVHVIDKSPLFLYGGYYDPVELLTALRAEGSAALDNAQKALEAEGVVADSEVVETENLKDDIAHCLKRYAEQYGADLVVLGTHGRRGVQRVVLGSVAERFVRFSTCPVLLLRGDE